MKVDYIDSEEKELLESLDDIDLNSIRNDSKNISFLKQEAKKFQKKQEAKMSIRISKDELEKIKEVAKEEGLKYQTFIKSVLHKYLTGQLVDKKQLSLIK